MQGWLLVALGGAVGSVARYKLSGYVVQQLGDGQLPAGVLLPAGTFSVNVLGCLVAGLLAGLAEQQAWLTAAARLLLFTGLLGGFTTFSAFGLETLLLFRQGLPVLAVANVLLSVVVGLLALWLGMSLTASAQV
jgi:fluoride exporter